ncbi:MAG TPA: aldo/keto reductase, partial [Chitinophagaceae bacterium]|nr:aldo/keto reductase [Chitinophagaceae bacterium]
KALEPVWNLCGKYNCTKTQLALSYILSYPEVSTVIPGIRTASQAVLNTSGLFQLDQKDKMLIEDTGKTDFAEVMKLIQQQG